MGLYKYQNWSNLYLFLVLMVFWSGCQGSLKPKVQSQPQNKIITLVDSTQLELPPTFILAKNLNSENQLMAEVFADFLANLKTPPIKVTFFVDSLVATHHLAAYQMDHTPFNQNMAALLNTRLTQQFQRFDENQDCYYTKKVEALQYASQEWNALKLKFQIGKDERKKEDADCFDNHNTTTAYTNIFYYNGQEKVYFFLEYADGEDDLDAYLRKIRL